MARSFGSITPTFQIRKSRLEEIGDLCGPGAELWLGPESSDRKAHGPDICSHLVGRIQQGCVRGKRLVGQKASYKRLFTCYAWINHSVPSGMLLEHSGLENPTAFPARHSIMTAPVPISSCQHPC